MLSETREKNTLDRLSVLDRCVSSAVQRHEEGTYSGHNDSQRNDGILLNDKTKPSLKPDAKIQRMTESHVKCVERPLQSACTSARMSERIRTPPGGKLLSACWTAYKMERASRTMMFSSREKPPYAANPHYEGSKLQRQSHEVRATLPSGKRYHILVRT